ncbi:MAG TPA: hypothetical protein VHO67_15030, partial [Polyangia bacterium]|nr:hypothetical protein [Polyangia bacterium]
MSLVVNRVGCSCGFRPGRHRVRSCNVVRLVLTAGLAFAWMGGVPGCANRGMESTGDAGELTGASGGGGHATGGMTGAGAGSGGGAGGRASGGSAGSSSGGTAGGGPAGAGGG